jgi:hypothetical protein
LNGYPVPLVLIAMVIYPLSIAERAGGPTDDIQIGRGERVKAGKAWRVRLWKRQRRCVGLDHKSDAR